MIISATIIVMRVNLSWQRTICCTELISLGWYWTSHFRFFSKMPFCSLSTFFQSTFSFSFTFHVMNKKLKFNWKKMQMRTKIARKNACQSRCYCDIYEWCWIYCSSCLWTWCLYLSSSGQWHWGLKREFFCRWAVSSTFATFLLQSLTGSMSFSIGACVLLITWTWLQFF